MDLVTCYKIVEEIGGEPSHFYVVTSTQINMFISFGRVLSGLSMKLCLKQSIGCVLGIFMLTGERCTEIKNCKRCSGHVPNHLMLLNLITIEPN